MEMQTINANIRDESGKGPARRRRVVGEIPAVVYGEGSDAISLSINAKAFIEIVHGGHGEHAVVQLEVAEKPELSGPTMIKAVQHHPIREHVMHADFQRIRLDKPVHTLIPITLSGHCIGIVEGGVPDQQLRELEIECLPLHVPENFDIDITDIAVGGRIHVSDLTAPEGMIILTEGDRTILAIHPPRVATKAAGSEDGEGDGAEDSAEG